MARPQLYLCVALALLAGASAQAREQPQPAQAATSSPSEPSPSEPSEGDFAYDPGLADPAPDPLEPVNRATFSLNLGLQRVVIAPVAKTVDVVVPGPAQRAVARLFSNLRLPVVLVNHLLQLRIPPAAATTGRFVVNSTIGVAGLFDPATGLGLAIRDTDFGETLARCRVPGGPYLVLPLAGPTTARDGIGRVTDLVLQPLTLLFGLGGAVAVVAEEAISEHDARREALAELGTSSVDVYAAVRAAYLMSRQAQLEGGGSDPVGLADAAAQLP